MKTLYGFWGKLYIYGGLFYFPILIITVILLPYINLNNIEIQDKMLILFFLFIASIFGMVNSWLHPFAKIEDDGVLISRLFFVERKLKWNNIKLYKKVRTITRLGLIGLDPRYALIIIKDATIFDKHIIVLPFFKNYDEFISEIEKNIDAKNVFTDKNYY